METGARKAGRDRRGGGNRHCAAECGKQPCTGRIRLLRTIRRSGKRRIRWQSARSKKGAGRGHSFDRAGQRLVEFVPERPVVAYDVCWQRAGGRDEAPSPVAAEHQIHIGVENVANKFPLSAGDAPFIDEIGSEWIGSYFDVGNVVTRAIPSSGFGFWASASKKVHFQGSRRNPGGLNCSWTFWRAMDWPAVMVCLKVIGYDGWATGEMIPAMAMPLTRLFTTRRPQWGAFWKKEILKTDRQEERT